MNCIESSRLALLWNGDKKEWFNPGRGIRHGDSISSYIFILCIERLSHLINHVVDNDEWKGIKLSRQGPVLTHIFFANDMVHFTESLIEKLELMLNCLEIFCKSSGQKVNYKKSQVFVSNNVDVDFVNSLANLVGTPLVPNLGK